jgi:hypothetical protein
MKDKIFPVLIVLVAVLVRFLPHPANVAPIAAMALFGGAYLNKKYAVILPLIAMLISDLFLGFHNTMPFVYGSFLVASFIGLTLKNKVKVKAVLGASLLSSVIFYVVTNFGVWLLSGMYEMTILGLIKCYVLAIPFFRNTLAGDLFYTVMMFGGYEMFCRFYKKLGAKNLIEQ